MSEEQYTTGKVAKILGISFRTLKRWIYSGKVKAVKTVSGRYRISEDEVERLKSTVETSVYYKTHVMELVERKRVAYLRELQICLEDDLAQWDTYHKLTELVSEGRLKTEAYSGNRWYFPSSLGWEDVKGEADRKVDLIKVYSSHPRKFERRGVVYEDYSEFLVEGAMLQAGYTVVSKDAYYFNGVAYRETLEPGRPKDLDFIARIPNKDVYVGVQVKNKLEYPTEKEISQLIDITNVRNKEITRIFSSVFWLLGQSPPLLVNIAELKFSSDRLLKVQSPHPG